MSTRLLPAAWVRRALRGVVLAMAAGTAVFFWMVKPETWARLAEARRGVLALVPVLVALAWACNGARTWLLAPVVAKRIRYRDALGVTLSVEFALAATPGGVGGVPVRLALSRRLGIPPEASLAIMAADVAADLVFFALLWPFAAVSVAGLLTRSGLGARLAEGWRALHPAAWLAGGAAAACLLAALAWRAWRRRKPGGRLEKIAGAARRTAGNVLLFWRRGKRRFAAGLAVAAVQWTCRYGILPLTFHALGVEAPVLPLMLLQGCLFLLSLLVVVPGGGGSVELLSGAVLPLFAPAAVVGPALLIWRVATYHLYVLAGGTALWRVLRAGKAGRRSSRETKPAAGIRLLEVDQLKLDQHGGLGGNSGALALLAVGEPVGEDHGAALAPAHLPEDVVPAGEDIVLAEDEMVGTTMIGGGIDLLAGGEEAGGVVDGNGLALPRGGVAGAGPGDEVAGTAGRLGGSGKLARKPGGVGLGPLVSDAGECLAHRGVDGLARIGAHKDPAAHHDGYGEQGEAQAEKDKKRAHAQAGEARRRPQAAVARLPLRAGRSRYTRRDPSSPRW